MEKSAAETAVSAPNGGGSSFGIKGSMVAMAIARRGTRPCDVCGLECAKWYCAADDAYLCERCDGSVHGANAVALRHERLKLGPNGVPMKNVRRILPLPSDLKSPKSSKDQRSESGSARHGWHHGTMRRPRSARPHPHANSVPKVKAEPGSPKLEDLFSDEFFACSKEFACGKEEQEVPIFVPIVPDHCFDLGFAKSEDSFSLEPPSTECLIRANTGLSVADECDLDRFLECDGDLCEMDSIMGNMEEFPSIGQMVAMDGKDMGDDNYNMDFSEVEAFRSSNEPSDDSGDCGDNVDGPLHDFCGKVKMEEQELDKIKLEVDEMLGCAFSSVKDEEGQQKISLRLNYEDVMSAWSDRGPFWTEGPRPQTVPDVCNFDTMDMIVPDYGFYHMEQNGQVPVMHMGDEGYHRGREARVMRYREKRRTRLFSKKIRYEVRKLNAERRPRLKGRFVKRSLCS